MNKKIAITMLVTILILSMSIGTVTAKKPDTPPGKPVEEVGTFEVCIVGDLLLKETVFPYDPEGSEAFVLDTYVEDWNYIDGVSGGDSLESYGWSYWDGEYGKPMISFGLFEFNDVFRNASGYDFRPVTSSGIATIGKAHMWSIGHGVNIGSQMDWWFFSLNWTREVDGKIVDVLFIARTDVNDMAEGSYTLKDGTVDTWTVTFFTEGEPNTNTEFRLMYSWEETVEIPLGKSGRIKEEVQYQSVKIWDLDGGPQPTSPLSITVTVDRLS